MLTKAFKGRIASVQVFKKSGAKNPNVSAILNYDGGAIAHVLFVADSSAPFSINAIGSKGEVHFTNQFDANPYLSGVKKIVRMFRTGIMPYSAEEMLEPIFILHALNRSYQICQKKKIRRLTK